MCRSWSGFNVISPQRNEDIAIHTTSNERQLQPLLEPLLTRGYAALSADGGYFERALYRATLRAWLRSRHHLTRPPDVPPDPPPRSASDNRRRR